MCLEVPDPKSCLEIIVVADFHSAERFSLLLNSLSGDYISRAWAALISVLVAETITF